MSRLEILEMALITARDNLGEYGNHTGSCYQGGDGCDCGYYDALMSIDQALDEESLSDATGTR